MSLGVEALGQCPYTESMSNDEPHMPHRAFLRRASGALVALSLTATGAFAGDRSPWDLEIGGGLVLYSPNVTNIPSGSSDTATEPLIEASLCRSISQRLSARLSGGYAQGSEITWQSRGNGGTAELPTPSIWSALLTLEAPLLRARVSPFAAVGGGLLGFGRVDEIVRFDWGSYSESNVFELSARTDPAVVFEVGATTELAEQLALVMRYRLLSVFARDQVDTIDRVTLSARLPF